MGKKGKNYAPNTTGANKKKKKQNGPQEHKLKSFDKNSRTKFKHKAQNGKQNIPEKIKQMHKNKEKQLSINILNSSVAKVLDNKVNNTKNKKQQVQIENDKTIRTLKKHKHTTKKKIQNQNLDQSDKRNKSQNLVQKPVSSELQAIKQIQNLKSPIQKLQERKTEKLQPVKKKKKRGGKKKENLLSVPTQETTNKSQEAAKINKLDVKRLQEMLAVKEKPVIRKQKSTKTESLRDRMMAKLRASRFRYLNETLYNSQSSESKKYFKDDPDAFTAYHDGYKQQIEQWPLNPLDMIISSINKMPKEHLIADFGCGEARLASSVHQKVHSFDFVSLNEKVTACDMAHTPLLTNGVHVVVFCLSLMGTNLSDYIIEANRVLKKEGILKIAEVESRFENVEDFIQVLADYGFKNTWRDLSHNLFYFLDFKKEKDITGNKNKLPPITLKPCLYKKR